MPVSWIDFHPNKHLICTASDDRTWQVINVTDGECQMSGSGHSDWLSCAKFSPSGNHVATSSGDRSVRIWDLNDEACVADFDDHTQARVANMAYFPNHLKIEKSKSLKISKFLERRVFFRTTQFCTKILKMLIIFEKKIGKFLENLKNYKKICDSCKNFMFFRRKLRIFVHKFY